jgi:hypothetical protein
MTRQPSSPAVDDEDPNRSPMERDEKPTPTHRKGPQDSTTRDDLPDEAVQPGLNEATDDPN